ncbi:FAD-dependent pyridine nucleotide-disulfide oxidoreductase [Arcobacter nitrofigilis DSM 7299]|uniref:FAD-dependent pyridine nucleotide-disulfide oxidoreductase n=1 Tax=Arcobacter nitrofigilis (strain ATCC 33309 / DSM 7299 / CCUG 15893 / LMG 7604 / NCTC 12251 / CI) TaxID=572480 RepID=D5UZK1_ARCNC|nr:FAD-dependent oxidoreductase [Arcobacter nitrofigilis]ADG92238.1 FAD-dependent pyridine nucleotide-disulfide oxidoreductase [Arcobacter nitrofigilis DSM 7299]
MFNIIKKNIVIIGGGYSGISLVEKISNNKDFEVTLINKNLYHLHQTDIHKYISGQCELEDISFNLEIYCKNIKINFIEAFVEDIEFKSKRVILNNNKNIKYDYLVIATGSASFFPKQIKNIQEYAADIKELNMLKEQRAKFLELLDSKEQGKNIAIIGGGLSGVEIALEFANVIKKRALSNKDCQISLIEQFPNVLPNMNSFLVNQTKKACDKLNIKRYHGAFVNEVKDKKIYLSDSTEIPFDMVLFLIGVSSEKLSNDESAQTNIKNQFVVDEYLRLANHEEVFVMGDVAETKDKNGNYVLPTAQIAKLHANIVAENLLNSIEGNLLIKNKSQTKGVMVDLANKNTVGIVLGIKVKGFIAYFLKRYISKRHTKIFNY